MLIPPFEPNRRFIGSGSCYSSYPTVDRLTDAFTAEHVSEALAQRSYGAQSSRLPLALNVHVPFYESQYFCSERSHRISGHVHKKRYLHYLEREVDLHTACLGLGQTVSQLRLAGEALSWLSDGDLRQLLAMLRRSFIFVPGGEYSVEIDPRTMDPTRLALLAELGFNRLSFGIQEGDPAAGQETYRAQPAGQVASLVESARAVGIKFIHIDLVNGLPQQTAESLEPTLEQVMRLGADCVALHAYDQGPHQVAPPHQSCLADPLLAAPKQSMLSRCLSAFEDAGYIFLGMGHFVLPNDALAVAKRQGRLHCNLLGYSTRPDSDLIGLGMAAIGRVGASYSQNAVCADRYYGLLDQGRLPVMRGLSMTRDDLVRRSVITALVCHEELEFESINLAHLIDFKHYFAVELAALSDMRAHGLVEITDTNIRLTAVGAYFAQGVAAVFDRYLRIDRTRASLSAIN